jgi:hypothetical protein
MGPERPSGRQDGTRATIHWSSGAPLLYRKPGSLRSLAREGLMAVLKQLSGNCGNATVGMRLIRRASAESVARFSGTCETAQLEILGCHGRYEALLRHRPTQRFCRADPA